MDTVSSTGHSRQIAGFSWAQYCGALLGSIVAFYPSLVPPGISPRLLMIAAAVLLSAGTFRASRPGVRELFVVSVTIYASLVVFVAGSLSSATGDALVSTNLQRLLLVTPLFLVTGYRLQQHRLLGFASRPYLTVATGTAVLACVESIVGRSLFGRDILFYYLSRDGTARAILAGDQPLVLASLMVIAIPMASGLPRMARSAIYLVLLAGIAATGSRGPLVLGLLLAVALMSNRLLDSLRRHTRLLVAGAVLSVALIWYLSSAIWTTEILGSTGGDYSSNYRWALYAVLPSVLLAAPLGYGMGQLPPGLWLAQSEAFGVRDLTITLDSELVYSAFTLGWIGVAAVITAFLLGVRAMSNAPTLGLTAAALSVLGFSLALHAWDGLGAIWVLVTGASAQVVLSSSDAPIVARATEQTGSHRA